MPRVKTVFIGWGAINSRVGDLLQQRRSQVDIVGIATRNKLSAKHRIPAGVQFIDAPERLAAIRPDLVIEAAGRAAVGMWAPAALQHSKRLIVASTSAFCDDALLSDLKEIASRYGSQMILASGAIGAIDALSSAAVLKIDKVTHQVIKPPQAWKGTPAEKCIDLEALAEKRIFFSGSVRKAASAYPQNANATVVTALAGIGLDRTEVELMADPQALTNGHRIIARGAFGELDITLRNNPLRTNPKSSELTALSLVRLIEKQSDPLQLE
jgi:aspartate dehydrogenase